MELTNSVNQAAATYMSEAKFGELVGAEVIQLWQNLKVANSVSRLGS